MTLRLSYILLFSTAAVLFCPLAQADPSSSVKSALGAVYASRDKAFLNKDVSGTLAPYAAQVVVIDADAHETKGLDSQRQDLAKIFASNASFPSVDTKIEELVADKSGKEATTKAVRHTSVLAGSATGAKSSTVVDEEIRDHWVKGKNGWHITQERLLNRSLLLEVCNAGGNSPVPAVSEASRLTEPEGGFSYVVPDGWQVKLFDGMKFRSAFTTPAEGFAPNITVVIHDSPLSLSEYVRQAKLNITRMKQQFPGFHWTGETSFVTDAGLHGFKLSSAISGGSLPPGLEVHQILYQFAGHDNKIITVNASIPASVEDQYASVVDAAMKTFALK